MLPYQIDDRLEQLQQLLGVTDPATNHHTVPMLDQQVGNDDGFDVVAPVQADQTRLDVDTVIEELSHTRLKRSGHRFRVPRTRDSIRVEPDDEDVET